MLKAMLFLAATSSSFITYSGFINPENVIEMTADKGLILEFTLRCSRKPDGQISAGIISYSKVERLYCSSRNNCYSDVKKAVVETCNWRK